MATPAPFLRGSFETFSLAEVFGVLALSRQYYDLRFSDDDGEVGTIAIKAGQVVGAEDFRDRSVGADALDALIDDPGTVFAVAILPRDAPERSAETPIGALAELVPEATDADRDAEPAPPAEADGGISAGAATDADPDGYAEALAPEPADAPIVELAEPVPETAAADRAAEPAPPAEAEADGSARAATDAHPAANGAAQAPGPAEAPIGRLAQPVREIADADRDADPAGYPEAPAPEPAEAPGAAAGSEPPPAAGAPDSGLSGADEVILHGNVSDASFAEILEVLQLSDQPATVVFIAGGARLGTLTLKSGQVLDATAGSLRGLEAFERLYADHGETFEVRRAAPGIPTEGLGAVSRLLADMQQAPDNASSTTMAGPEDRRSLFMRGRLSDFPLELLVGSLHLSRQWIQLEFRREDALLHRVHLKAGKIVGAESAAADGAAGALAAIRGDPGDEFFVYRCKAPLDGPAVASLADLFPPADRPGDPLPEPAAPAPPAPPDGEPVRVAAVSAADSSAEILAAMEDIRARASAEIQAALAASGRGPRDRVLLWWVLGLQAASLAVATGALVLSLA